MLATAFYIPAALVLLAVFGAIGDTVAFVLDRLGR